MRVLALAGLFVMLGLAASAQEKGIQSAAPTAPVVPFSSNGCSGFREAMFFTCCFVHDFSFWAGGNWTDRRRADKTLRRCIIDIGKDRFRGDFAYFLVRLGLVPGYVGVDDGWGRAWRGDQRKADPPRARFSALTPEQKTIVADEKIRVCRGLTLDRSTGNYTIDPRLLRTDPRELHAQQAQQFCGAELSDR
jgi:hypothetical protein